MNMQEAIQAALDKKNLSSTEMQEIMHLHYER